MSKSIAYFIFYLIVLITNVIQTISGFAGTMLAMPLSIQLIGFEQARFILNLMGLLVSVIVLYQEREHVNFKSISEVIFFMFIGMVISKLLTQHVEREWLFLAYGVIIILFAIYQLIGKNLKLNRIGSIIVLLLAGIIHGLFVSGGALLVIYAMDRYKDKNVFRANLSLVWVILNSILFINFFMEGNFVISPSTITWSTLFTLIGVFLGGKLVSRINQKRFSFLTKCLLLMMGIMIIVSG